MKYFVILKVLTLVSFCQSNPVYVEEQTPCPSLPPIEHGAMHFVQSEEWSEVCRVTFTCDAGYTLNGTSNVFCFYGEWTGDVPTCTETSTCPAHEVPTNGRLAYHGPHPANHIHSIVEVVCNDGYLVDSDPFLLCTEHGLWSEEMPKCIPHSCNEAQESNATIEQNYHVESSLSPIDCNTLDSTPGFFKDSVRYDIYNDINAYSTWQEARSYCQSRGGDLAVAGLENMTLRENMADAILREGSYTYLYIGLEKINGVWTYIDGSVPDEDSIHWWSNEPSDGGEVAYMYVQEGSSLDLLTAATPRSNSMRNWDAFCEYNCLQ